MKRYLEYDFRRQGIVLPDFAPNQYQEISLNALPKVRGQIFHTGAMHLTAGMPMSELALLLEKECAILPDSIRKEQLTLIRRALLGWDLTRGQWWRDHFTVVSAEEEWIWQLSQIIHQPLRLDKILRRIDDGMLGIADYKTISSVDPNWPHRMMTSAQTHTYVQALKEYTNEWILGICYDAVVIGSIKYGSQRSPFVLGFEKNGKVTTKWSSGCTNVDLTTYSDAKWLEWIQKQPGELENLYQTTGFLNPAPEILLHTKNSLARAEEEWYHRVQIVEDVRSTYGENSMEYQHILGLIERNDNQCYKYGMGHACQFVNQCWHGQTVDDDFIPRTDHHQNENEE